MVRLLLDQNLSFRIAGALADLFPESLHVRDIGLSSADDAAVWRYARDRHLVIVTKDSDFNQAAFLFRPAPKVVWLRIGNCSTDDVVIVLRRNASKIIDFVSASDEVLLTIDKAT